MHHLVAFLRTSEERSMTRAAAQLFITQPALSAKIRRLETELGKQLFVRRGHGVELTEAGKAFQVYAERIVTLLREGVDAARAADTLTVSLSIGAVYSATMSTLPPALARFGQEHPGVNISITAGNSPLIFGLVLSRAVQLGIIANEFAAKGIQRVAIGTDPIILVAARDHPLAQYQRIPLRALRGHRLILSPWGAGYSTFLEHVTAHLQDSALRQIKMDPTHGALRMVELGLGACFLPLTVVADSLRRGTLRAFQVSGLPPLRRQIMAIYYRQQPRLALLEGLIEALQISMRQLLDSAPVGEAGGRASGGAWAAAGAARRRGAHPRTPH